MNKQSSKKTIGLLSATGLGISSIIGSGWLFAPYQASVVAGPASILSWIIAAVIICLLGARMCLSRRLIQYIPNTSNKGAKRDISIVSAYLQGFLCNLLNPKATLFFLALFTIIIKPGTSYAVEALYALEMFLILTGWFCFLTLMLSHKYVMWVLERIGPYLSRILGLFLIGFALMLFLVKLKGA